MKSDGEIMEILNAYDLTGSYRAAGELCGCSHHTVQKAVEDRDRGLAPAVRRAQMIDDWRDVLEGWVADSRAKIRADMAHQRLQSLGYAGSGCTTRRAVAEAKAQWRLRHTRVHRPWITEPGLWLQYDFGDGRVRHTRRWAKVQIQHQTCPRTMLAWEVPRQRATRDSSYQEPAVK